MGKKYIPKPKQESTKEEGIEVEGVVVKVHANARCDINIGEETIVSGYISGKMRQNFIRVLAGDKVTILLSPYDPSQGRIVRRHR